MNQAEAEAHLPPVVLPEVNGIVLPNYERVNLQDLQQGSFYYLGGTGAAGPNGAVFGAFRTNNFLIQYEGIQDNNYIFTFYKTRSKVPLGPWIDDMEQGLDFSIANLQYGGLRFYIYQPGLNLENMNINGGLNGGALSYYHGEYKKYIKRFKPKRRTHTRKANKKRSKQSRRN